MTRKKLLNMMLDYKKSFYDTEDEDYKYWYDYLITLNKSELIEELIDHKIITEEDIIL